MSPHGGHKLALIGSIGSAGLPSRRISSRLGINPSVLLAVLDPSFRRLDLMGCIYAPGIHMRSIGLVCRLGVPLHTLAVLSLVTVAQQGAPSSAPDMRYGLDLTPGEISVSWSVVESGLNRTKNHPTAPEVIPRSSASLACWIGLGPRATLSSLEILFRKINRDFPAKRKSLLQDVCVYTHTHTRIARCAHMRYAHTFTHVHAHMRSHIHAHLRVRGYDLFIFYI